MGERGAPHYHTAVVHVYIQSSWLTIFLVYTTPRKNKKKTGTLFKLASSRLYGSCPSADRDSYRQYVTLQFLQINQRTQVESSNYKLQIANRYQVRERRGGQPPTIRAPKIIYRDVRYRYSGTREFRSRSPYIVWGFVFFFCENKKLQIPGDKRLHMHWRPLEYCLHWRL